MRLGKRKDGIRACCMESGFVKSHQVLVTAKYSHARNSMSAWLSLFDRDRFGVHWELVFTLSESEPTEQEETKYASYRSANGFDEYSVPHGSIRNSGHLTNSAYGPESRCDNGQGSRDAHCGVCAGCLVQQAQA